MIFVSQLLDQSWPQRIGGVERYVDHLFAGEFQEFKNFRFSTTTRHPSLFDTPYTLVDLLSKSRDRALGPRGLGRGLIQKNHGDRLDTAVYHIHQLLPYGLPNLIDLAGQFPTVITLHDYFLYCQKVHFFPHRSKQCDRPGVLKCSNCISKKMINPFYLPAFWLRSHLVRRLLSQVKAIVLPNSELKNLIEPALASKIHVIPYAIPELPPPSEAQSKKGFVYLGTLGSHKGIFSLLNELKTLGFTGKIDIFGPKVQDGIVLPEFASFRGALTNYSQLETYQALILPSLWKETGPLVVLEALRAGLPVLARKGSLSETYSNSPSISFYESPQEILEWTPPLDRLFSLKTPLP